MADTYHDSIDRIVDAVPGLHEDDGGFSKDELRNLFLAVISKEGTDEDDIIAALRYCVDIRQSMRLIELAMRSQEGSGTHRVVMRWSEEDGDLMFTAEDRTVEQEDD
jgi:hypothetical protein